MHQKVKARRFFRKILAVLLPILLLAGLAWGGYCLFDGHYLFLDGNFYRRNLTQLDLSNREIGQLDRLSEFTGLNQLDLRGTGLRAAEYEQLQTSLPNCEILWEPCFQGQYYPLDISSLSVSSLTEADVIYLDYFTALKTVDATACSDYEAIMMLIQRRPECKVSYQVSIGQQEYLPDAAAITVPDGKLREIEEMIGYLPALREVLFTGTLPALEEINQLSEKYPHILFDYQLDFYGHILTADLTSVDFSRIAIGSAGELEAVLPYMPDLRSVDVTGCGIPHEQMAALSERWSEIQFTWTVNLGGVDIRTDMTEFDISGHYVGDAALVDSVLPYFPNLKKVIMCGCGIGNEEMDALNRKYEDIKIIWSVQLGDEMQVRTDITTFIPVKYNVWMEDDDTYNLRYCTDLIAIDMGHMDICNIDFVAYMPHLKYLLLCDSQVNSLEPLRGLQELMYLEIFLTKVTDYSPLLACPALEDLNISWTYGYYEPLTKMTQLKRLWWGGTGHGYYEAEQLNRHLPNTQLVLYDGDSTGSGWRQHKHYYEMRDLFGMYYME